MQNDDHRKAFATASHAQEIVRKAEMIAEEIRDLEGEKTDDDMPGLAAPVYDSGLVIPSTVLILLLARSIIVLQWSSLACWFS